MTINRPQELLRLKGGATRAAAIKRDIHWENGHTTYRNSLITLAKSTKDIVRKAHDGDILSGYVYLRIYAAADSALVKEPDISDSARFNILWDAWDEVARKGETEDQRIWARNNADIVQQYLDLAEEAEEDHEIALMATKMEARMEIKRKRERTSMYILGGTVLLIIVGAVLSLSSISIQ